MRQLIWKEWHEQRWKLGFGCVVLCAFATIGLHARIISDQSIIVGTCALGVLLLPILSAAGLIPAERGEGTLRSLRALPIAPWVLLATKAVLGIGLCALPLFAAAGMSVLMTDGREVPNSATLAIYVRAALTAVSLFVWMLSATARSPSEGRGAALAVGVLVCWLIATSGLLGSAHETGYLPPDSHVPSWLWAICPFVFVYPSAGISVVTGLLVQIGVGVALWLLAVRSITADHAEGQ